MRIIPAAAQTELAKALGTEPLNILGIEWTDDGSIAYYADRDIGDEFPGRILALSEVDAVVTAKTGHSLSVDVTLDDTDGTIKNFFDTADIHKRPAKLYQYFGGLDTDDKFLVFDGEVSTPFVWDERQRTIQLSIVTAIEDKQVGFSPEVGQFNFVSSDAIGKPWPLAFGKTLHVPATKIKQSTETTLRENLCIVDPSLKFKLNQHLQAYHQARIMRDYYVAAAFAAQTIAPLASELAVAYGVAIANEDSILERIEAQEAVIFDLELELADLEEEFEDEDVDEDDHDHILNRKKRRLEVLKLVIAELNNISERVGIFKERVEEWVERAKYEHKVRQAALKKQVELTNTMGQAYQAFVATMRELCRQTQCAKSQVAIEPQSDFIQNTDTDVIIDGVRWTVQFDGTRMKNIAGPKPTHVNVKLGARQSVRDNCNPVREIDGIDTFWVDDSSIRLKGQYLLVTSRWDNRKHIIKVVDQIGAKCIFELIPFDREERKARTEELGPNPTVKTFKFPVFNGSFGLTPITFINQPLGVPGFIDPNWGQSLLTRVRDKKLREQIKEQGPLDPNGFNRFRFFLSPLLRLLLTKSAERVNKREGKLGKDMRENQLPNVFDDEPPAFDFFNRRLPTLKQILESIIRHQETDERVRVSVDDEFPRTREGWDKFKAALRDNVRHFVMFQPATDEDREAIIFDTRPGKEFGNITAEEFFLGVDAFTEGGRFDGVKLDDDGHPTGFIHHLDESITVWDSIVRSFELDRDKAKEALEQEMKDFAKDVKDGNITKEEFFEVLREELNKEKGRISKDEFNVLKDIDFLLRFENLESWLIIPRPTPRRVFTIIGQDILAIQQVSRIPLASWFHTQLYFEEIPDDLSWEASAGSVVRAAAEDCEIYVANILPSSIRSVAAYRQTSGGSRVLQLIPSDYYAKNEAENLGDLTVTSLRFYTPLSYMDEGWDDQVYVSMNETGVGNQVTDIIQHLVETYTDKTVDATSFAAVKALMTSGGNPLYPANFALFDRKDVITQINEIATQARCAVFLKNGVFFIKYLSKKDTSIATITKSDIIEGTLKVSSTSTDNLVTEQRATWRTHYLKDVDPHELIFRYNVKKYGLHSAEADYYIYNIESLVKKSMTFWGIRNANSWKLVEFALPLTFLKVEPWDTITIDMTGFGFLATADIDVIVESANYDTDNKQLKLACWVPVRVGEMAEYAFAFPADLAADTLFPPQADIDAGLAGSNAVGRNITGPVQGCT